MTFTSDVTVMSSMLRVYPFEKGWVLISACLRKTFQVSFSAGAKKLLSYDTAFLLADEQRGRKATHAAFSSFRRLAQHRTGQLWPLTAGLVAQRTSRSLGSQAGLSISHQSAASEGRDADKSVDSLTVRLLLQASSSTPHVCAPPHTLKPVSSSGS